MKINWKSIGAGAVSVFGIVSSPVVAGMLPAKAAAVVAAVGIVLQAFTHPVAQSQPASK